MLIITKERLHTIFSLHKLLIQAHQLAMYNIHLALTSIGWRQEIYPCTHSSI